MIAVGPASAIANAAYKPMHTDTQIVFTVAQLRNSISTGTHQCIIKALPLSDHLQNCQFLHDRLQ